MNTRLKLLQSEIKSQKLDAVLITNIPNIIYLTNYSGFSETEREAFLLVTPQAQTIFTDGRYSQAVKKLIPDFKLLEISSKNKFKDLLSEILKKQKVQKLGVEESNLKVAEYKQIKKVHKSLVNFNFHHHRAIKTEEEIKLIKKSCEIGDKTFDYIQTKIKSGMSEKQLMFFLESFIREQGFEPSFKTIVAFGENSAVPHHQTGDRKLKSGDLVLLDFGVRFKNYCSDMTRTLIFGTPSEKQFLIHETVKEAQQKAFEYLKQNFKKEVKASELDKIARDYIVESGFPSIPHSLGHGIGIEVHEPPYLGINSKNILKEGMVFSIEPGIYLPELGGVRIEDLYVIEKNGVKQLTASHKALIAI